MRILHAKMYLNGIIENNKDNPDMQNIIGQIKKALKELEDWKMSVLISPEAYKKLLQGDLNWLLKQPECLEKEHIEAILKNLIKRIEEGKEF